MEDTGGIPVQELDIDDDDLEQKMKSLMSKHKIMKKREHVDKELARSNSLLSKYDTTRVLALKARNMLTEQREMLKQINVAVTNNEEGDDDDEFLERVAGYDFSENAIASPQRGSIRPRPQSASGYKTSRQKASPVKNYEPVRAPSTPKADKKKKKKTYQSDLQFYDPPQYPSPPHRHNGSRSPNIASPQKPKQVMTSATFNPDEWWREQKRLNPHASYRVAVRRSNSEPVLKRPKSASSKKSLNGGDQAMSTKDLKSYLKESRNTKTRPPSSRMYLAEHRKKKEKEKEAIMTAILEEANNRETKVHVSLDEANSYAKYLGLTKRYSAFWRSADMNNKSTFRKSSSRPMNTYELAMSVEKTDPNQAMNDLRGTGARMEKMMVEVMEARGEATKLISVDNFFKEHEQLQLDVRKKRNLMSSEQRVQEERDEKNKAKEAGTKRKGLIDKQESFLDHLEKMKAKEAAKNATKSSTKMRRKETEEKVNKILENTANVTRILENQLKELQSRGWNESTT